MATVIGSSINESATVVFPAASDLSNARGLAVKLTNGKVAVCGAGEPALGLALMETDEVVKANEDVDIQIKDIGKWVAGAAITAGALLASDANGKAVAATSGAFIVGVALSDASAAGTYVKVQISKSGYKA